MTQTTRERLLDEAERLTQQRGFNAFSFKALAQALEIKTASVHYHFPTKADLGLALIRRYRSELGRHIQLQAQRSPRERIARYIDIFVRLQRDDRLCLCGSLAADLLTLSDEVREEVRGYLAETEAWLEAALAEGREAGELAFPGSARATARALLALLEGAILTARSFGASRRLPAMKRWILDEFLAPAEA